jgi:para-aminobenzoate synthetase component 1
VNLTFPTRIDTNLSLQNIYDLSDAKYKLLVNNEFVVFSPESFIKIKDGTISSFPMKGTIRASIPGAEEKILLDTKEIAEHNTIVDLIRNDLSIVATDITVKRFRYLDRITTNEGDILQVSSEIVGKLPENYYNRLGNIMFELLPAGSVTGAPKQKTLEIISHVEGVPRGYYSGIFGCFDGENLESAVMIRFIENRDGQLWFRSGGGITCNSLVDLEYQELIDKVYVPFV